MSDATGPAAYTLYDVLRELINKVPWPSEADKRAAVESVTAAERVSVLGNVAGSIACVHETGEVNQEGRCIDCGRLLIHPHTFMRYGKPNIKY